MGGHDPRGAAGGRLNSLATLPGYGSKTEDRYNHPAMLAFEIAKARKGRRQASWRNRDGGVRCTVGCKGSPMTLYANVVCVIAVDEVSVEVVGRTT